jgi:hypothetical protein
VRAKQVVAVQDEFAPNRCNRWNTVSGLRCVFTGDVLGSVDKRFELTGKMPTRGGLKILLELLKIASKLMCRLFYIFEIAASDTTHQSAMGTTNESGQDLPNIPNSIHTPAPGPEDRFIKTWAPCRSYGACFDTRT